MNSPVHSTKRQSQSASSPTLSVRSPPAAAASCFDGDAAATICAYIILHNKIACSTLAMSLGLPPLVVEECVRNGESSSALRAQLSQWLQENSGVASAVPPFLISTLHEACAADELVRQKEKLRQSNSSSAGPTASVAARSSDIDDGSLLAALDPLSRQHFTALRNSVGHSFVSILNDPGEAADPNAWGSWLGGRLYEAFDYNGRTPTARLGENLRLLKLREQQNPESSASLLLAHPMQTDFSSYISDVTSAYNANQKERQDLRTAAFPDARARAEELPWPKSVPAEFFHPKYSAEVEVESLPEPGPSTDSAMLLLPSTTTGNGAEDYSALEKVRVVGPGTFRKDYEALEERTKTLRGWEGEVEGCLLQHVQSRSEDFFAASVKFTQLSEEGRRAMEDANEVRTGGVVKGAEAFTALLGIGALYRRQKNFEVLNAFLGRALKVFRQLQDIGNWATLPERDMAELHTITRCLLDLEGFLRVTGGKNGSKTGESHRKSNGGDGGTHKDSGSGEGETEEESQTAALPPLDSWDRMSQLKIMSDVPARTATARRALEDLVQAEIVSCLSRDLSEDEHRLRTVRAMEAAALLGVLERAIDAHKEAAVCAQWSAVKEKVVAFLMSSNTLDDAKANELLSLSSSSAAEDVEPTTNEKRALFTFTASCRFDVFLSLVSQLLDLMTQNIATNAQNWGFVLLDCLPTALAMYGDSSALAQRATRGVLGHLCSHAESIVALLVDARSGSKAVTGAVEIEQIAHHSYLFLAQVLQPVRELVAVPGVGLDGLLGTGEGAIQLGKLVGAAVHKLAKRFLKNEHTRRMEKLQMVIEAETWSPKEDIDPDFQMQVEELCKCDAEAIAAFDGRCLEQSADSLAAAVAAGKERKDGGSWPFARRGGGGDGKAQEDDGADADLLSAKASKLYVSLDGDGDGRVVGNSLLLLVELLSEYNDFLSKFPSLAFDVVMNLYDLLALYDSLCAGMVLGAQAMEKGSLKSITTTHLCVASQCCAFLADLIPQVQQRLRVVLRADEGGGSNSGDNNVSGRGQSTSARKLLPFINTDLGRVAKDCSTHRCEFLRKMASLVIAKVDSLGAADPRGDWTTRGNEWVMTMLREVARLIRALRPLLPPTDLRGVVVPLVGSLAIKIRQLTRTIPASAEDARTMATSDVLLFKLNVERFGFDVLRCAGISSAAEAMVADNLDPTATDQEALSWFFPSPPPGQSPSSPPKPQPRPQPKPPQ